MTGLATGSGQSWGKEDEGEREGKRGEEGGGWGRERGEGEPGGRGKRGREMAEGGG